MGSCFLRPHSGNRSLQVIALVCWPLRMADKLYKLPKRTEPARLAFLIYDRCSKMAIDQLLRNLRCDAKEKALMKAAFERALAAARLHPDDAETDLIASRIVHIVQRGELNLWRIVDFALQGLRKS